VAFQIIDYRASDGATLSCRRWSGDRQTDAVFYLHGIESHSEWFSECAEAIAGMNTTVYAPDRRGSGLNHESRGHCRSFHQLIDDVLVCTRTIAEERIPIHLAALSWGAKLAVAIDMLHAGTVSAITLISPGIFPRVMPGMGERVAIAVDSLIRPHALHPIPIKDEMFTSIPRYLEYIANDPLRLHRVTARFYLHGFLLDRLLKKRGYQWSAPTQLLLAEHDAIIDNRRTRKMFDALKAHPKRINIYEGCNHSLQFEQPGKVAKDIVDWIRTTTRD